MGLALEPPFERVALPNVGEIIALRAVLATRDLDFVAATCHFWQLDAMKFEALLAPVGDEPLFETALLLAGDVDPAAVHRQLSRWVKAGRLYQLRRGLCTVAPPFQRVRPHPYVVANRLVLGSYVTAAR